MIGRLCGQVVEKNLHHLVVDVAGVGYIVLAPERVIADSLLNEQVIVHTYLQVREDALTLYGFATTEDKLFFEQLVGVSGIGPKLALAVLSAYKLSEIQTAILAGQVQFFTAVSGIGKKNAERIILELKNKVGQPTSTEIAAGSSDLTEALTALGYSAVEVARASQGVPSDLPLEAQIKQGLRKLSQP